MVVVKQEVETALVEWQNIINIIIEKRRRLVERPNGVEMVLLPRRLVRNAYVARHWVVRIALKNRHLQRLNAVGAVERAAVAKTLFGKGLELLNQHLAVADNLCKPLNWRPIGGA